MYHPTWSFSNFTQMSLEFLFPIESIIAYREGLGSRRHCLAKGKPNLRFVQKFLLWLLLYAWIRRGGAYA